jgi:hypothetical protein
MSVELLQQIVLVLVASSFIVVAGVAARRGRLSFGIASLWTGIGAIGAIGALLVPAVDEVGAILGVVPAAVLAGAASLVLAIIAFSLSVRVSSLEAASQSAIEAIGLAGATSPQPSDGAPDTLVIVPAWNEAKSVGDVVHGLHEAGLSVLVIDDGSTDGTALVARDARAGVISLPSNLGVGGALRAGFRYALEHGYSQVVQCDGDGQHPTEAVLSILAASQASEKTHLLIGSRFTTPRSRREEGFVRWSALSLLAWIASRSAGRPITDATSGLRVVRHPLLEEFALKLPRHYLGDTFESIVSAARAGFVIDEHPVTMTDRLHGASTATWSAAVGLTLRAAAVTVLGLHRRFDR